MKYLFLDTNIFLHFKPFNEIPWANIVGSSSYTIVIPLTVVDELDKQKSSPGSRTAKKAKSILPKIEDIIDGNLISGLNVIVLKTRPSAATLAEHGLIRSHQDDCILASILTFETNEGEEKLFITNDAGAKVRAKTFNISCPKIPSEYRLEDELDEGEKKIKALELEIAQLKLKQPNVSLIFEKTKSNQLKHSIPAFQTKEDFIQRESSKNKRNNPLFKKQPDGLLLSYEAIIPAFMRLSDVDKKKHNIELEKFYLDYELYLAKEYEYKMYLSTCIEIELSLINDGTVPAEDIDVHLHFPDGFELLEELKEKPKAPMVPKRPDKFNQFRKEEPILPVIGWDDRVPVINKGPKLVRIEKTNSYDVEFKVNTLKHNQTISLPKLFVCYTSKEEMKNFHIDSALMISNFPQKVQGQLHVVFENNSDT